MMTSDDAIAALQSTPKIDFCDTDCEDIVWLFLKHFYADEQGVACDIYRAAQTNPKILGCMHELVLPETIATILLIDELEKQVPEEPESGFWSTLLGKLGF